MSESKILMGALAEGLELQAILASITFFAAAADSDQGRSCIRAIFDDIPDEVIDKLAVAAVAFGNKIDAAMGEPKGE
jgi:hypothetical protein